MASKKFKVATGRPKFLRGVQNQEPGGSQLDRLAQMRAGITNANPNGSTGGFSVPKGETGTMGSAPPGFQTLPREAGSYSNMNAGNTYAGPVSSNTQPIKMPAVARALHAADRKVAAASSRKDGIKGGDSRFNVREGNTGQPTEHNALHRLAQKRAAQSQRRQHATRFGGARGLS